jgi:hypothetical protein
MVFQPSQAVKKGGNSAVAHCSKASTSGTKCHVFVAILGYREPKNIEKSLQKNQQGVFTEEHQKKNSCPVQSMYDQWKK